ncbi:uncharacterized protein METZ01_LOCUS278281 [marine metagenome]|uniref:Uncharacterized protein n=1 Tax=marine metagenome TaxID=408172 RepID=A0A382KRA4_9ZZZZ
MHLRGIKSVELHSDTQSYSTVELTPVLT